MREQAMLINLCGPKPARASALVRCKYILGAFLLGVIAGRGGGHASAVSHTPSVTGAPWATVAVGTDYWFRPIVSNMDGDSLAFSISGKPTWATFNTNDGELAGVPAATDIGASSNIVITVSDGQQSASMAPFGIQVMPPLPPPSPLLIAVLPNNFAQVLIPYVLTPTVRERDSGRILVFSISGKPAWATFDPSTGTLSGTPRYTDIGTVSNIVINVSDGLRSDSTGRFSIEVVYSIHVSRRF